MCGICGFSGKPDHTILKEMGDAIRHRGPDGEGYYEGDAMQLCSRRLAIVDLPSGRQPVSNEDGSILCIFNGEIYNHRTIRRNLEQRGHTFRTSHCDTEVLIHLYEEYGLDFATRLNGMFAIAIWDRSRQKLILVRDRMGVKPLFYTFDGKKLIFASEIKSILRHPAYQKKFNYSALYHYFSFQDICSPDTAYAKIQSLRPGTLLTFSMQDPAIPKLSLKQYWSCHTFFPSAGSASSTALKIPSLSEAAEHLSALLSDAVSIRLLDCDVEVGCFLSGGLDSSLITALACEKQQSPATFCLSHQCMHSTGLYDKAADSTYARNLAETLSTRHLDYSLSPQEFMDSLDSVWRSFDQPFSGSFSTFYLSRQIAKKVKCTLSGDGADELFGSYHSHKLAGPFSYFAKAMKAGLQPDSLSPDRLRPFETDLPLLKTLYQETGGSEAALACQLLNTTDELKSLFLTEDFFASSIESHATRQLVETYYQNVRSTTPLNRTLEYQFSHMLPDQVLCYTDTLSMANSLEVRSPFLDYRIVEYMLGLPDSYKIHNGTTKYLLKQSAKGILPDSLIHRSKEGFIQPTQDWMGAELWDYITDILSPDSVMQYHLLRPEMVLFLLRKYKENSCSSGPLADVIWNLVCFQGWCRLYL